MILTTAQYKLDKSSGRGYKTVGLNLSPALEASTILGTPMPTMCAMAGACAAGCLAKTGMNVFPKSVKARAQRTKAWIDNPAKFVADVLQELDREERKATRGGMSFCMRLNLLSDQRKLAVALAKARPNIQFYDYTKLPLDRGGAGAAVVTKYGPFKARPSNYHLTYSVSERTTPAVLGGMLQSGVNPAIVFDTPRNKPLPSHYTVMGRRMRVIDGDADDLRFLDPVGVVVGLRWKGSKAKLAAAIAGGFAFEAAKGKLPGKLGA